MARPRKDETRALDTDERGPVETSQHPAVQALAAAAVPERRRQQR
jgi:hypothetical protein